MSNHKELKKIALDFLKSRKAAVVATASRSGEPQAAILFYAIDDDFTFNFIVDNKSKKFQNLKENPHVVIVVGEDENVISIQCGGHAEIVDYLKDTNRAETIIKKVIVSSKMHREPPAMPVLMAPGVEYGIFQVRPDWMMFLNLEYEKHREDYKYGYHKILP